MCLSPWLHHDLGSVAEYNFSVMRSYGDWLFGGTTASAEPSTSDVLENDGEASKSIRVGKFIPLSQVVRFIPSPLGPFRSAEFFGGRSEQLVRFHDYLFRRGDIKMVFKASFQID